MVERWGVQASSLTATAVPDIIVGARERTYKATRTLPSLSMRGLPGSTASRRFAGTSCTVRGWTLAGVSCAAAEFHCHWMISPVQLALAHLSAWIELKLLASCARLLFRALCGSRGKGVIGGQSDGAAPFTVSGCQALPRPSLLARSAEHGQSGRWGGGQTAPSPACWIPCRTPPPVDRPSLWPAVSTLAGNQKWVKLLEPTSCGGPNATSCRRGPADVADCGTVLLALSSSSSSSRMPAPRAAATIAGRVDSNGRGSFRASRLEVTLRFRVKFSMTVVITG